MSAILARVARLLDLERPTPGERTSWTVRTAHGVHLVELEQFVSGVRVRLDGTAVGQSPAWAFPTAPFRFEIGGLTATLAVTPDSAAGTVRATLIVDGARVRPDLPAWRARRVPPIPWVRLVSRAAFLLGMLLFSAAAIGDPFREWVVAAVNTAVDVAWLAAVRGVDPFGFLPAWLAVATSSRAGLVLLSVEVMGLAALASEARLRAHVPGLRAPGRLTRVACWAGVLLVAALLPTLLAQAG